MAGSDDDDDYMNMVFEEAPKQETALQRRMRIEREGRERGRIKSKAERDAEAEAAREAGLAKELDSSNKGFKMMAKFGFKKGDTLGKSENARKVPIHLDIKEDKGGIGLDSEKKRKFREHMEKAEQEAKRSKVEEGDYRDRVRQEREEKKAEKEFYNAQRTVERLHEQSLEHGKFTEQDVSKGHSPKSAMSVPLKEVNVVWRGLIRHRLEKQRNQKQQRDLKDSLTARLPTLTDDEEDEDDKLALGREAEVQLLDPEDEEDSELEEFDALSFSDRLEKIVLYLRETYHYCFWCKHQYVDATLDGCPGITEEDHD
ncbi:hypothetical protein BDV96DRAFT_611086 [Lophiotrema nucula]|uniref:G-patch domain-containing protein n=1 Tax=Lophiotrema nucula TaxID=690887 RepID=A0A6A5ZHI5_9PLEO|nr:hypothetical protein BDV96DRAFT_611086 [Lophiotrema nucula]